MDKVKQYLYYFLIGIVSLIALVFLPMLGSTAGLSWNLPTTTVGWIVFVVTKLIVAILNILIFHCFMQQAKVNIHDNPNYQEARRILQILEEKEVLPRSPKKWNGQQYGKKGVTIFVTSLLSVFALTQAILTFDYVSMLTYLFTIIMGLIFGIIQMKSAEEYWVDEYYEYALMIKRSKDDNSKQQTVEESGGTSTEEQG